MPDSERRRRHVYELVTEALRVAEEAARDVVTSSLSSGDYVHGRAAIDYAESIKRLRVAIDSDDRRRPVYVQRLLYNNTGGYMAREEQSGERGYPSFFVEGDRLVKIGVSRAESGARFYRHETPRAIFDVIVNAIGEAESRTNGRWSVKELEALLEDEEIPKYHIYTVLAAARETRLLQPAGRGAYAATGVVAADTWWGLIQAQWPSEDEGVGGAQATEDSSWDMSSSEG